MAAAAGAHSGGRAAHWAAIWRLLACQEEENFEVIRVSPGECIPERVVEKVVELAESPGVNDTTDAGHTFAR